MHVSIWTRRLCVWLLGFCTHVYVMRPCVVCGQLRGGASRAHHGETSHFCEPEFGRQRCCGALAMGERRTRFSFISHIIGAKEHNLPLGVVWGHLLNLFPPMIYFGRERISSYFLLSTNSSILRHTKSDQQKQNYTRAHVCAHLSHVQASPRIKIVQLDAVVDPLLEGRYPPDSMCAMAKVAVECVEQLSIDRPNMTEVANRLGALMTMQDQLARGQSSSVDQGSSVMSDHILFSSEAPGSGMGGTGGADSRSRVFYSTQIGMGRWRVEMGWKLKHEYVVISRSILTALLRLPTKIITMKYCLIS